MNSTIRTLAPLAVFLLGLLGAWALVVSRVPVKTRPPAPLPPLVRVLTVTTADVRLTVRAQGSVTPRTESALVPEVSGRVVAVAPAFAAGGFFEQDEVLVTLEPGDYDAAVARARATLAQAASRLAMEEAEAEVARREWEQLAGRRAGEPPEEPPPLVVRAPQREEARAALAAAQATLDQALRDRERTLLRAPFAGRVRQKSVDVGQFVNRGTPLASLYAVDAAEVRLPIPDDQLAFLDLPPSFRGAASPPEPGPEVLLRARFAGRESVWTGRIVRLEGELDPRSRMVTAVARVEDPYGRKTVSDRPPLAAGLFVEAEILGRTVNNAVVLPRAALRGPGGVWIVEGGDRLRHRAVEILRADRETIVLAGGLAAGERVCLTPLDAATDGMAVRVHAEAR